MTAKQLETLLEIWKRVDQTKPFDDVYIADLDQRHIAALQKTGHIIWNGRQVASLTQKGIIKIQFTLE